MATDDNGGNPTEFSGVTFIGRPKDGRVSYHIQRSGGKTLGPFDAELVVQMIRGNKLTGDEAVSTDRQTWTPILSVPAFADAFAAAGEGGSTNIGIKGAVPVGPGIPPRLGELSVPPAIEDSTAHRLAPSDTSVGMGTGDWQALDDDVLTEESFVGTDPSAALSGVPGVRRLSPDGSSQPTNELPMPEGFTNFPLGDGAPDFSLPKSSNQATMETNAPPRLGGTVPLGGPPPAQPGFVAGTLEMPGRPGSTMDMPSEGLRSIWDEPTGDATIEHSLDDLPISAQGVSDLPASLVGHADLPQATGRTNLPVSAAGLPTPAANLPRSAAELPATHGDLPVSAGHSQFGTMAMSGLGSDLPGTIGGPGFDDPDANTNLPASARGAGASVLDSMAQADDIWAAPDAGAQGRGALGPSSGSFGGSGGFDTKAMQPGFLEPAVHDPYATDALHPHGDGDDFSDFFPGGDGPAVDYGPEGDELAPPPVPEKGVGKKKAKGDKARKRGGGWGLRIALMLVLLAVLGGAAFLLTSIAKGPAPEQDDVVVAPIETRPVTVVEVPPISVLADGAYRSFVDFVDIARTAVGDRGTPEDRASFLIGASLLFFEHAEHAELHTEMSRTFHALDRAAEGEISDTNLVALARAAYLAATADEGAPDAIRAAVAGPHAAWAHLFAGVYEIQKFRGVSFADEEQPEEQPEEATAPGETGFAPAADDEGAEGETEGEPAEPEEPAQQPTLALDVDDEDEAPQPPTPTVLELSPETASHFDAAIAADGSLVPARYWRGWVALEQGEAEAAHGFFEGALEQNPEHVNSDIGVARSLMKQARLADADARIQHVIDDFEAVSSSMQRSDTFVAAAEIAIARMQPEIAIESLLSALQASPTNPQALRELGEQFFRAGQFGRAVDYFGAASDAGDDNAEVMIGTAMARYGLQEYDAARTTLESGLEKHPRDGRFPYWLGRAYEDEAEFELARQYYRQAMQTEPDNVRPLVRLAQLSQRENMATEALRLLDEATATNGDSNAQMANEIGEMYVALGETNRGVSSFRLALDIDGSQPDARINLTQYYLDSGQQSRAIEQLQIMLDSGVESPRVRYLNARALHGMGQYDRAIEELLTLQEADANNPDYLFLLGRVHFDAGNFSAARQQFVRAWEQNNQMTRAQYYIGRCDIELGGYNEAITSLTAASHRSASGEYHYWLGVALERANQPAQALSEYDQTVNGDIAWSLENPEVFSRRGRLYYARGAMSLAYRDLRMVLTLRPRHADASWNLGRVHYAERNYGEAIRVLEYSLSLDATRPEVHYHAGLAYLRVEPPQPAVALQHLEAARDGGFGTQQPELFQKLAFVYRDMNRRAEAAAALEAFLAAANLPYDERRETENEIHRLRGTR